MSWGGMRSWISALIIAFFFFARPAFAQEVVDRDRDRGDRPRLPSMDPTPPRLPAPFVLPDLSHPRFDVRIDQFGGRLAPTAPDRPGSNATITRLSFEGSVIARRLFVGLAYPFASGLPPDGGLAPGESAVASGRRTLFGNVEAHIRSVFPLPTSLEIGFGLGVVAPTATFDRDARANRSAAAAITSFDPTNALHFYPERVGLRPAGDLRIIRGPVVFQGRHGLDIVIDGAGRDSTRLAGRLVAHLGILLGHNKAYELSVEASQLYIFGSDEKLSGAPSPEKAFLEKYRIDDSRRNAVVFGPGFRYSMRDLDLGATFVTNVNDPFSPVAGRFVAAHVSIIAHLGRYRQSH
jgi:hypothetical protein